MAISETQLSQFGVEVAYADMWGQWHRASDSVQEELLRAMNVDPTVTTSASSRRDAASEKEPLTLEPVYVIPAHEPIIALVRTGTPLTKNELCRWELLLEQGSTLSGTLDCSTLTPMEAEASTTGQRLSWKIHDALPLGYHTLKVYPPGKRAPLLSRIIACPAQCYRSPHRENGPRPWGLAVNLYAVRSESNWGIGDFGDLKRIVAMSHHLGLNVIGLNPLHALFPSCPENASPYSPSSRLFLNVLYLDIDEILEYHGFGFLADTLRTAPWSSTLNSLRATSHVDYSNVTEAKLRFLDQCYGEFLQADMPRIDQQKELFEKFIAEQGDALLRHCTFEALEERYGSHKGAKNDNSDPSWGWTRWPKEFHDASSAAVTEFSRTEAARIRFWAFLQWHADRQLHDVAELARHMGLQVGLYRDFAISAEPAGAEVWTRKNLYALNATVGAPPDLLAPQGQNWGLPPLIPHTLKQDQYLHFAELLRSNMRHAGALRIDHVMGLYRLFWVPKGRSALEGTYVRYPLNDLLGILALESQRQQCTIIGEDLGTVPDEVRAAMHRWGILSYKLFLFERDQQGEVLAPRDYPASSLVAVTTHDLPTFIGFWMQRDIALRDELKLYARSEFRQWQLDERKWVKESLIRRLQLEQLWKEGQGFEESGLPTMALRCAIHFMLARTPAEIFLVQLEDLLGVTEQINLPGTVREYPNWRRKLPTAISQWFDAPGFLDIAKGICKERG